MTEREWDVHDFKRQFWATYRDLAAGGQYSSFQFYPKQAERWAASIAACLAECDEVTVILRRGERTVNITRKVPQNNKARGKGLIRGLRVLKQFRDALLYSTTKHLTRKHFGLAGEAVSAAVDGAK